MVSFLVSVLCTVAMVYAGLVFLLWRMQRHLIYHPEKSILPIASYGLAEFSEYSTTTVDNETIQLWYHEAKEGFPTIAYFHGNAYHMGSRAGIYNALENAGFGVLGVSYRGYGKSTGQPSEAGLYNDARAAIAFLMEQKHVPVNRIMLYGESLGTGVAIQMGTEFDIAALVLQAPYTSVAARAAEIYYFIPVNLMIMDGYNSLSKISSIHKPILMFHGEADTIIPIAHAKALYDAANSPKEAVFFPGIGHNDFDSAVISEHVLRFTAKYQLI